MAQKSILNTKAARTLSILPKATAAFTALSTGLSMLVCALYSRDGLLHLKATPIRWRFTRLSDGTLSLYNVMTMQKDVHDWFDRLDMWFETVRLSPLLMSAPIEYF
jgi:hypothetical protein